MTIFVFYVNPQTLNIANLYVNGGPWSPGGISSFFSSNFPSNAVRIMAADPFLTRVMTIFIKTYIFVFYVSAQIPNIEYFEVCEGIQAPGGISLFVS